MFQKAAIVLCLSLLFAFSARAQEVDTHQSASTAPPAGARYEIVQSPIAARWTFRLDRYTGHVDWMVQGKEEKVTWQAMTVMGLPKPLPDGKARYQIFTSGIAARYTLLINVESGQTWQIMSDKETEEVYWSPLDR